MLVEAVLGKAGIRQLLADGKKRSKKDRAALEMRLAIALDFERRNPWIVQ